MCVAGVGLLVATTPAMALGALPRRLHSGGTVCMREQLHRISRTTRSRRSSSPVRRLRQVCSLPETAVHVGSADVPPPEPLQPESQQPAAELVQQEARNPLSEEAKNAQAQWESEIEETLKLVSLLPYSSELLTGEEPFLM